MKTLTLLSVMIFALSCPAAERPLLTTNGSAAESSVPTGAKVSLKLPNTVKIGDAVIGTFTVKNASAKPFEISTGGDYRGTGFPQRLKIRVTDAAGNVLPDASQGQPDFGGFESVTRLAPGESHEIPFPLAAYVTLPGPGNFTVEASHDLGWVVDPARPHPVAKTTIKVVLPTPVEAAARVRELCASDDPDRIFQLDKLKHEIFLPPLIREAEAGNAVAVTGIAGMSGGPAMVTLLHLLENPAAGVVMEAGKSLLLRLPILTDPSKPAFPTYAENPTRLSDWRSEYRAPLLKSARALLASAAPAAVELGAAFIQAQGDADDAAPLLAATQTALDAPWEIRSGKGANVLDPPPPLRSLINAIDALRGRGWSPGPDAGGGTAVILARFRELADPMTQRPAGDDWKQTVLAFLDANPPTLRQNALLAIPIPISAEFEKPLMKALDDPDWGVLRTACEVAGKSGNKGFIRPLCRIVETTHESFVLSAASDAARALGARTELWNAWCEVIADQDFMFQALRELALGTLDLPTGSSNGNSNFTRGQRFAIRDAWHHFLEENHDRLAKGERLPPDDPTVTPVMTGSDIDPQNPAIRIPLKDGRTWPQNPTDGD